MRLRIRLSVTRPVSSAKNRLRLGLGYQIVEHNPMFLIRSSRVINAALK